MYLKAHTQVAVPLKSQAKNKQQQEAKAKSKAPYISSRSPIQEAKHEK